MSAVKRYRISIVTETQLTTKLARLVSVKLKYRYLSITTYSILSSLHKINIVTKALKPKFMVSLDKVVINQTHENVAYREAAFVVNNLQLLGYYFVITVLCVYKMQI